MSKIEEVKAKVEIGKTGRSGEGPAKKPGIEYSCPCNVICRYIKVNNCRHAESRSDTRADPVLCLSLNSLQLLTPAR